MALSKKMLAIVGVLVIVVVVIIAAAALGGGNTKANDNNDNDNDNDNDNGDNTNTRDQIANVSYSGSGDKVSEKFELQAGVTIFHMTHSGSSNFAVTLYNEAGEYVDLLANEIGTYDGATLIGVKADQLVGAEPGKHYLQIEADGAWTIVIEQPRVASGAALPQTLTGSGPNVTIPIALTSGVAVFNMTHSGSSNFIVTLYADDGDYVDILANEIGAYSGEKSVTVNGGILNASPGIHWVSVDADGDWTIKITKM
ncbi:MAG: hypothetical protein LLG45_13255 [Actinomycetia bacterium]|nr:hypothetical protein [Actinomycetes bacterium]